MKTKSHCLKNGQVILFSQVPCLNIDEFCRHIIESTHLGARISSLFGMEYGEKQTEKKAPIRLVAVLADDARHTLSVLSAEVEKSYPSLTPLCPQTHMFEREIAEQWGVIPEGHPWLRPARFHSSYRPGNEVWKLLPGQVRLPGTADFFRIEGDEIHEVAVGPVHAGIIEPGHFRFQCHGEKVFHLEISLGYQHRGIERALIGGPHKRTIYQMETVAGDTTIGHTLAYCQAIEALKECEIPRRAQALRTIGLELERLANHTGDLGAMSGDVGFLPTASYCGRIRGDFLNMTALICGSRLGRGFIRLGGVGFDIDPEDRLLKLTKALAWADEDARVAVQLLWDTPAVMSRFEDTGIVSRQTCGDLGMVGPAARACGLKLDVRQDFPLGHYNFQSMPLVPNPEFRNGDVGARAYVRWAEIHNSLAFLKILLPHLPKKGIISSHASDLPGHLPPDSLVVSLVEGWRGEICHTAITDAAGKLARYKIVDPSFHNWMGLGMALRNQEISDFPLCNKSFNLSYCGFDL
ncbi:MAG: NADH-quinone oxidoreductase subunit C [Candidatus Ozemobacteraceae bacterium]